MTFDASRARRSAAVKVMRRAIVFSCRVTLEAHAVALRAQLQAMRLVTIAAGHTRVKHPALDEGAVLVDFIFDLSVGVVQIVIEQCDPVVVADRLAMDVILVDLAAPRMASRAHLDFACGPARDTAPRVAADRIDNPGRIAALVERDQQAIGFRIAEPRSAVFVRPRHMTGARPVAGLARDVDFRVSGGIGARAEIIVLAQVGRMAIGAHEIPVLIDPVQCNGSPARFAVPDRDGTSVGRPERAAGCPRRSRMLASGRPEMGSGTAAAARRQR